MEDRLPGLRRHWNFGRHRRRDLVWKKKLSSGEFFWDQKAKMSSMHCCCGKSLITATVYWVFGLFVVVVIWFVFGFFFHSILQEKLHTFNGSGWTVPFLKVNFKILLAAGKSNTARAFCVQLLFCPSSFILFYMIVECRGWCWL